MFRVSSRIEHPESNQFAPGAKKMLCAVYFCMPKIGPRFGTTEAIGNQHEEQSMHNTSCHEWKKLRNMWNASHASASHRAQSRPRSMNTPQRIATS